MGNYLTQEFVEKCFSDYKSYMIWIMIAFTVASTIVQYLQNLRLSKKVESFKNDLKKNEIKFSRFNDLQIESLKKLYDQVVTFHFKFNNSINPMFFTHDVIKNNFKSFIGEYNICLEYCHRNKIFLPDNLINKIRDIETNFKLIKVHFDEELHLLSELEEGCESVDPQVIYGTAEDEVESIKNRLDRLKSKPGVVSFEVEIKGMRDLIEKYFKELIK